MTAKRVKSRKPIKQRFTRYMLCATIATHLRVSPIEIEETLGTELYSIMRLANANPDKLYNEIIPKLNKRESIKQLPKSDTWLRAWRKGEQRPTDSEPIR